jgi:hypothetical protein
MVASEEVSSMVENPPPPPPPHPERDPLFLLVLFLFLSFFFFFWFGEDADEEDRPEEEEPEEELLTPEENLALVWRIPFSSRALTLVAFAIPSKHSAGTCPV